MNLSQIVARTKAALTTAYGDSFWGFGGGLNYQGWLGYIRESFSGEWQTNTVRPETQENILRFSAVFSCVTLISNDIAKLALKLMRVDPDGVKRQVTDPTASPFIAILRQPNHYQTSLQFISQWITTKLLYGNAYVLKDFAPPDSTSVDKRGMVRAMHVLDPRMVLPLISEDGDVYYQLGRNYLAGLSDQQPAAPADRIIHDRMPTLWHPLIGVTPIFAAGAAATQGIRIQANSYKFFSNMSRPSGVLTTPGSITKETAAAMKDQFEQNFSHGNIGRLLVAGDGLKYEPMTIPAADAQLIEQLRWTVEDVARCFLVPLHKLQASLSGREGGGSVVEKNQEYFDQALQIHIESMQLLLDVGIGLPAKYDIELDLDGLLRMDPKSRAETYKVEISAGSMTPNEARAKENRPPVPGGDACYLQQQNYSTEALAKRDALADPFAGAATAKDGQSVVVNVPPGTDGGTRLTVPKEQQEEEQVSSTAAELAFGLMQKFSEAARA